MYEQRYSEEILFKSIKNIRGIKLFSRGNTHWLLIQLHFSWFTCFIKNVKLP